MKYHHSGEDLQDALRKYGEQKAMREAGITPAESGPAFADDPNVRMSATPTLHLKTQRSRQAGCPPARSESRRGHARLWLTTARGTVASSLKPQGFAPLPGLTRYEVRTDAAGKQDRRRP